MLLLIFIRINDKEIHDLVKGDSLKFIVLEFEKGKSVDAILNSHFYSHAFVSRILFFKQMRQSIDSTFGSPLRLPLRLRSGLRLIQDRPH